MNHPLPLLLTGVVAALAGNLSGCADPGPDRVTNGATVRRNGQEARADLKRPLGDTETVDGAAEAAPADTNGPVGTSFADAGALPDIEGTLAVGGSDLGTTPLTENAGMQSFLNPNLASNLLADPGQTAKGQIEGLVTFGDISLVGVNLDELLDYIYKPGSEGAERFEFPEGVKAKEGSDKAVIGYMLPLEMKPRTDEVISFMLVRDLAACCFGGVPRPDEWLNVRMAEGKTAQSFRYVPVIVRGEFKVGRVEDEYGYAMGVYNLTAESVKLYEAPKR